MQHSRIVLISIVIGSLLGGSLFALDSDMSGRDVVTKGAKRTLTGSLTTEDNLEWSLKTFGGTYVLHFGPPTFLDSTGITLKEGEKATVYGYIEGGDISPVAVTVNARTYAFRDENGFPLWAGNGQGRNRSADRTRNPGFDRGDTERREFERINK